MFDSHQRQNEEWVEKIREENDATRKELAEQRVGGPYYSNTTSLPLTGLQPSPLLISCGQTLLVKQNSTGRVWPLETTPLPAI